MPRTIPDPYQAAKEARLDLMLETLDYRVVDTDQQARMEQLHVAGQEFLKKWVDLVPTSDEAAQGFARFQEAIMWGTKAITFDIPLAKVGDGVPR